MGDRSWCSFPGELVVSGAGGDVATSMDRLSSTDHEILTLLQFHRVLTSATDSVTQKFANDAD
jgi:hypothetical protein